MQMSIITCESIFLFDSRLNNLKKNKRLTILVNLLLWCLELESPSRVGKIVHWTIFYSSFSIPD